VVLFSTVSNRQPIHTVYGGAHLFKADSARRLGAHALRALDQFAPDPATLAAATGIQPSTAERVHPRVKEKLEREPVEDFRLDFEDGYGTRSDAEEDGHAESAAIEVANGARAETLPPFIGIRIKNLGDETRDRALRTTDLFLGRLLAENGGQPPAGFVVTLPKITERTQVGRLVDRLGRIETAHKIPPGTIRIELMVETPYSIFDERGAVSLPALVAEGRGRVTGAHFGTYDYTAALGITAAHQHMRHPACDFARGVMQVALAGSGVFLSDGATNVLPVGSERTVVHRAWRQHFDDIQHSLTSGFYQGWDLHPAQLVSRYAAVYAFFLESLDAASERLRNFIAKAAQATLVGEVFDDAATGQGLLNFFLRALNCGAVKDEEIGALTGLTLAELRSASFAKIVDGRRGQGMKG
jgi:citrate lyase beta subunit